MTPKKKTVEQPSLFAPPAQAPTKRAARLAKKPSTFREVFASRSAYVPRTANSANKGEKRIWFSATAMESMNRCPRCFWIEKHEGIRQPEGIVSRLANRFDAVIKQYFDLYRPNGELPPMIAGKVEGILQYPFQEKYWYRVPGHGNRYGFYGKLDECLVSKANKYTPVDHKTASSDPTTRELIPAYQFQLDAYAFLLEKNAHPTTGVGHLIYFFPGHGTKLHEGFPMEITIKTLKTDPGRVMPRLESAIALLEGPLPQPGKDCPFCAYVDRVKKF